MLKCLCLWLPVMDLWAFRNICGKEEMSFLVLNALNFPLGGKTLLRQNYACFLFWLGARLGQVAQWTLPLLCIPTEGPCLAFIIPHPSFPGGPRGISSNLWTSVVTNPSGSPPLLYHVLFLPPCCSPPFAFFLLERKSSPTAAGVAHLTGFNWITR